MTPRDKGKYEGYADHFLGEKSIEIDLIPENRQYVLPYLNEVRKRSDFAYRSHKSTILNLLKHVNKKITDIRKIDVKNYFQDIVDKKPLKYSTKNTRRAYLRSFFDYVEAITLDNGLDFNNPVPNRKVFDFSKHHQDIKKQNEKELKLLTIEQLNKILDYCHKNLPKGKFMFFALCICTGARFSEIMTVKTSDVNVDKRYLETGFEKNARKSTFRNRRALLFFFPKKLSIYLKNYIYSLGDTKWLFPSSRSKYYMSTGAVNYYVRKIKQKLGFNFSMHYFRHSMITNLKRKGCPLDMREMLLNHRPSSTQGAFYEHLSIEEKRNLYDRYFPYYSIPYF